MKYIIGCTILALAAYIMMMNWGCVIASLRNQRKGIDRHHSQTLVIPEVLLGISAMLPLPFPKWILLLMLGLHVGTWCLLWTPFYFAFQLSKKKNR